jgi:hypothetical protein
MSERPILFSAPMIRAILAGAKAETRRIVRAPRGRVVNPVKIEQFGDDYGWPDVAADGSWGSNAFVILRAPYGRAGDHLWVRETWARGRTIHYRADGERPRVTWKPSIYMPRRLSRIMLKVEAVSVQRLQDITEEDAKAEGVESWETLRAREYPCIGTDQTLTTGERMLDTPFRASFALLWDNINGKRATWKSSPWVWVVKFKRLRP